MRMFKGVVWMCVKKCLFKKVKGNWGGCKNFFCIVKEIFIWFEVYVFCDCWVKKCEFCKLWIICINVVCCVWDIRYSVFINGLKKVNIELDCKMFLEMVIYDEVGFD